MGDRLLLRASLHPLRVTSVAPSEHGFPGAIFLCPRLCWAAGLAELEQVEVTNLESNFRMLATVLVGGVGEASLPDGAAFDFEVGDRILVTATTRLASQSVSRHTATLVLTDPARNAALIVRHHSAREVVREPSFTPVARFPAAEPASVS